MDLEVSQQNPLDFLTFRGRETQELMFLETNNEQWGNTRLDFMGKGKSGDINLEVVSMEVVVQFLKLGELQKEMNQREKQKAKSGVLGNLQDPVYLLIFIYHQNRRTFRIRPYFASTLLPSPGPGVPDIRQELNIFRVNKSQGWRNSTSDQNEVTKTG